MAAGGPRPSAFYVERQALTRSPATPALPSGLSSNFAPGQNAPPQGAVQPGDGLVLAGLFAVTVSIYPWTGATLSGAGTLLCWIYNTYQQQWTRCSDLDLDLSDAAGFPAKTFAPVKNLSRLGLLINWFASGVSVSSGTDVLVRLDGFTSVLGMSA